MSIRDILVFIIIFFTLKALLAIGIFLVIYFIEMM